MITNCYTSVNVNIWNLPDIKQRIPTYREPCLKRPLKNRQNKGLNDKKYSLMKVESIYFLVEDATGFIIDCFKGEGELINAT